MLEVKINGEEEKVAKENINKFKQNMSIFFSSKLWKKFSPVMSVIYGNRLRRSIDIVEFTDNVLDTLSNIYNKFGYNIDRTTLETFFTDIITFYYYQMKKLDVDEGYYLDKPSFKAINDFIESLDEEDIKVLDPLFTKLSDILEK